jgi:hypothetical protein
MKYETTKQALTSLRDRFIDHTVKHKLLFSLSDLGGACGICSLLAFRMLKKMGYRPVFHMNHDHCFVTAGGYWVDLTLTQFVPEADEVFFHPHPYRMERGGVKPHQRGRTATNERAIRKLFARWGDHENPFKQTLPKLPKTRRLTKAKTGV